MESKRIRRIGNQIRQTLGELLLHDLRDPRIAEAGVVSITHVQVSPDLRTAKVYLSSSDESQEIRNKMVAGFRSAGRYLRGEVGRRLDLRRVPELRFELDETLQRAWNVERVLKEVGVAETQDESAQPEDEPTQTDETPQAQTHSNQGNTDDPTHR
jgi:ribosome-binding factor A